MFHSFSLCEGLNSIFQTSLIPVVALPTGEYHCPVLNKVFTEFTHIVAVKTTGNVFCYEVIFMLIKAIINRTKILHCSSFVCSLSYRRLKN